MTTDLRPPTQDSARATASSRVADVPPYELIVVSYRSRRPIEGLLAGLPDTVPVALVDNAAGVDDLALLAAGRPNTRYVDTGGGAGFARAANLGVRTSTFEYVVLVNPDTRPAPDTLRALVMDVASDARCASSAALNVGDDGRSELGAAGWEPSVSRAVVHALALHKVFPRRGLFACPQPGEQLDVDWTTGACMALHRDRFVGLGGFDERYYVYNEDVAYGRAVREHGFHQCLRTDLTVHHDSGGSGAPALEMMRLRGASLARYARHTHAALPARTIAGTVAAGYVVRAAVCRVRGAKGRSAEHLAYAVGAITARAWVGGVEVTARD